jgi:hypothetical protein
MLKLIFHIITLFAIVNCQEPPNGIIWAEQPHQQQPHQHHFEAHAAREAQGEEETLGSPLLGNPLIGLKMAMAKPLLFGIPGMRFSNFKMGHLGPIKYGNVLLGAENPYAADEPQHLGAPQQYQGAHYHYQEAEAQLGSKHHHHHHIQEAEAQLGSPQQYHGAHYHQAEANLGAPMQYNYGAEQQQYDSYNLGAPGDNQPQQPRPLGPIASLFQNPIVQPGSLFGANIPTQPQAPEQRTWDKGYGKG